ncbi:MAG: Zonular occludens toxin [Proteobacteria bacterium]|nr:Zonular occludens toxin [Pseudomonadota bacterium]
MAIKAYVGRMGSGKTYEVVTEVILGGLRRGRRVVSNIAGLDFEAMQSLLIAEGIPEEKIGQLVQIDHDQVLEPMFWRTDDAYKAVKKLVRGVGLVADDDETGEPFLQPGDLVALDEIWRFWEGFGKTDSDGKKRPDRVMNFFRMHRHFIHPDTGVACDVALITQDVMDISRQVRAVIEETYYMEKLTAIGSTSRYRVDVFQGGKTSRRPLRSLQRSYDSKYFGLYKSHSQGKEGGAEAVEENIDGRGNILKSGLFKIILPLAIPVFGFAIWSLWGFFHPKQPEKTSVANSAESSGVPGKAIVARHPGLEVSDIWRVVGYYQAGPSIRIFLSDGGNTRFLIDPPKYRLTGLGVEVELPEGGFATSYSGHVAGIANQMVGGPQ